MGKNLGRSSDGGSDEAENDGASDEAVDGRPAWREWFGGRRDGEPAANGAGSGDGAESDDGSPGASGGGPWRATGASGASADESQGSDDGEPSSDEAFATGLSARAGAFRERIDPRETAETAARGAVGLGLRIVGAVLVAYGLWVLVAVDGWARLGAAAVGVGFLPAFAPGFVLGLAGVLWKVLSLA